MKLAGFNATEHDELDDFSAIPAGDYVGKITESTEVENKKKTGSYLKLTFQITEGKFKGRKLWTNLNLNLSTSPEAVEIANRELATIMKACGKVAVEESKDLHGIEMTLKVVTKAKTANFPESNEIKNYKALSGVANPSTSSSASSGESSSGAGSAEPKKNKRVSF